MDIFSVESGPVLRVSCALGAGAGVPAVRSVRGEIETTPGPRVQTRFGYFNKAIEP